MSRLLILFFAATNIFAILYAPQPLLPMLASVFDISVPTASLAISLPIVALAVASLLLAPITDKWDRKNGILLANACLILPSIFLCFADSFPEFLLWRFWQGICIPGVTALLMAYAAEEFPANERGRVLGIYVSATVVGGLSGRIIGGVLADAFFWQAPFYVFALVAALLTVMIWRWLPPSSRQSKKDNHSLLGFLVHFANPKLVGTFFIGFSQFFAFIGVFTYIPFHVSQPPYSLGPTAISLLFVTFVFGILSAPAAGYLSDRIGRRSTMALGHLVGGFGIAVTLLPSIAAMVVGLSLMSAGNFASQSAATAYVGDVATKSRGAATSLYQFFYYMGGSLGAWLPGLLWDRYEWHGVTALTVGTILLALVSNHFLAGRNSWQTGSGHSTLSH
ncbi:MFS transporter [Effusibacillus lacus]|uniref:MFS transporter n=1 Tax=Effusibacillus lacus TaxID=1348429 RepID=A0A292YNH7_9BACL|nr:MFS transporter [Effusibacillus lacus]TCS71414.1 YNFM family putative membrane transporter [Effusibacillus lacus]GAX89944.1 MFS transporter [Effusibacillus lacus]